MHFTASPTAVSKGAGFTLTELIMVILIAGILAAVALPRFFDRGLYEERAWFEELLMAARYAQKVAVASGCTVRLRISGDTYDLHQRDAGDGDCTTGGFSHPVPHPDGRGAYAGAAPDGVTVADVTLLFHRDGRAEPDPGPTVTVGGYRFKVHAETAYMERLL